MHGHTWLRKIMHDWVRVFHDNDRLCMTMYGYSRLCIFIMEIYIYDCTWLCIITQRGQLRWTIFNVTIVSRMRSIWKMGGLSGTSLGPGFQCACILFQRIQYTCQDIIKYVATCLESASSPKVKIFKQIDHVCACANGVFREFPAIPSEFLQNKTSLLFLIWGVTYDYDIPDQLISRWGLPKVNQHSGSNSPSLAMRSLASLKACKRILDYDMRR